MSITGPPSGRAYPFSVAARIPSSGTGPLLRQGNPFMTQPGSTHKYADFKTQGQTTGTYIVRPTGPPLEFERKLHEEQLLFVRRGVVKRYMDREEYTIVNFSQINYVLEQGYTKFLDMMQRLAANGQGKKAGNPVSNRLVEIFERPSILWRNLKDFANPDMKDIPESNILEFINVEGIVSNFSILGVQLNTLNESQKRGIVSRANDTPYKILSVVFKGAVPVTNYWGEKAQPGAELFVILKRKFDSTTQTWGSFAFIPWAQPIRTSTNFVKDTGCGPPKMEVQYEDFVGRTQYGVVFYIGNVIDNERKTFDQNIANEAAGLSGTLESNFKYGAMAPSVLVNMSTRFHGCHIIP